MSKRKFITIYLALASLAMVGFFGTSAYFVSEEKTHNIITSGSVSINLIEETNLTDRNGKPLPFENIKNAMPGETYSKIPKIKNVDKNDVYVRILVKKSVRFSDGTEEKISDDLIKTDYNLDDWLKGENGYYYYSRVLKSNETTTPLFSEVTLSSELSNLYQDSKFSLALIAEGVQAKNNGETVLDAEGWPEE